MSEPLPYATPSEPTPPSLAREIFGVIVRTFGLLTTLYALYGWCLVSSVWVNRYSSNRITTADLAVAAMSTIAGLVMLKGGWVVRFAYGRER